MKTAEIKYEIPKQIHNSPNQSTDEFSWHFRLYTPLYLFKNHKLSFSQASELTGMNPEQFLSEPDKNKIDFIDYNTDDLEVDIKRFSR